jgi:hypothetical protein
MAGVMQTTDLFADRSRPSGPQVLRLIGRAISQHRLDLTGLSVLTEAGVGSRSITPVIAALAGAEVYAVTRDTQDGARLDAERETLGLAGDALVRDRVHLVSSRLQAPLSGIDIVTNLPGVRPIDETILRSVTETAAVTLMCGVAGWQSRDVDVAACRRLRIAVAGLDEDALRLHRYVPTAALWGLLALGVELVEATVVVAGGGPAYASAAKGLARAGARVLVAAPGSAGRIALYDAEKAGDRLADAAVHARLPEADALVLCADRPDVRLIGPGSGLDAGELAARAPHIAVVNLSGELDRRALAAAGLRFWPAAGAGSPQDLLPQPLIDLHTAGLRVGEVLARARRRGSSSPAAEQLAAAEAYAELLPKDLSALRR